MTAQASATFQMPKLPPIGVRVPRFRMPRVDVALPTGPRLFLQTRKNVTHLGGPQTPPPGFVVASTSASEWFWYWASMKKLDTRRDPRRPPFYGGELWLYQASQLGAFVRQKGSAVVDFFYKTQYPFLAVRIQTYRFHLAAPSLKQAYDRAQLVALLGYFDSIDVYEGDFIGDASGAAVMRLLTKTLQLNRPNNPILAGNVYMRRNALTTQR